MIRLRLARLTSILALSAATATWANTALAFGKPIETTFENGLRVLVDEDHSRPQVAVDVVYHVGFIDDPPDQVGASEIVREVIEDGISPNLPLGARHMVAVALGAASFHSEVQLMGDRTEVIASCAPHALAMLLWSEAERMATLADSLSPHGIEQVTRELENRALNRSLWGWYSLAAKSRAVLYGAAQPLGRFFDAPHTVFPAEKLRAWVRDHYAPANATVVISGDVASSSALQLVREQFGRLPRREPPVPANVSSVPVGAGRSQDVTAPVPHPAIVFAWSTPKWGEKDDLVLDIVARVLDRRLGRVLEKEPRLALELQSKEASTRAGSTFLLRVVAASAHTNAELRPLIERELARLGTEPPGPDELASAKRQLRVEQLQMEDGPRERAQLIASALAMSGASASVTTHRNLYEGLSAADVTRVVQAYLGPNQGAVVTVTPDGSTPKPSSGKPAQAPRPQPSAKPATSAAPATAQTVHAPPPPSVPALTSPPFIDGTYHREKPPASAAQELLLGDGSRVRVLESHAVPLVRVSLVVRWPDNPPAERIPTVFASSLWSATPKGSELSLEHAIRALGGTASGQVGRLSYALTLTVAPEQIGPALALLRSLGSGPSLDSAMFVASRDAAVKDYATVSDAVRAERFADHLLANKSDPDYVEVDGGLASLKKLELKDLSAYMARALSPANVTYDVVGDVTPNRIAQILKARPEIKKPAGDIPVGQPRSVPGHAVFLYDDPKAERVQLMLIFPSQRGDDPSMAAIEAVLHALRPIYSPMNDVARQLSLAGVRSWRSGVFDSYTAAAGPRSSLSISLEPGDVHLFIETIRRQLIRLAAPTVAQGVAEQMRQLELGWMSSEYASMDGACRQLDLNSSLQLPVNTDLRKWSRLFELDGAQVANAAAFYFRSDQMMVLAVGPTASLEGDLMRLDLGPVKTEPAPRSAP